MSIILSSSLALPLVCVVEVESGGLAGVVLLFLASADVLTSVAEVEPSRDVLGCCEVSSKY